MFETTKALILREVRYKESDRILTVLTDTDGKRTLKARGALRKGSKMAAATQQLTFSELTLFENRGRATVNEATLLEPFEGLRADFSAFSLGCYFAEVLEAISEEGMPDPAVLQLALNSLYALSRGLCAPAQVKAVFELRLMAITGYEPDLTACPVWSPWLYLPEGTVYCGRHRSDAPGGVTPLHPDTLAAMRHIVYSEPKRIFSFTLEGEPMTQLSNLTERYLLTQLDRGFSSLDYWKKVKDV